MPGKRRTMPRRATAAAAGVVALASVISFKGDPSGQ